MKSFRFVGLLCGMLALGAARADGIVTNAPAAGLALTPASAPNVRIQSDLEHHLAAWRSNGWTGVTPRYIADYRVDGEPGINSRLTLPDGYLLERVTSCREKTFGFDIYRVQRVCAATSDEPGFNLDTFENNWEHPRYVLYPGGDSPYAASNVFAFAMSDIHWTLWGARETYYPLEGDGNGSYRQPQLQVQSAIVTHDVPYGTPSEDVVPPEVYRWDPAGDFFNKAADDPAYNYGIGDVVAGDIHTGEIVSNWTPSVIWQQTQSAEAPTGIPTYRFEYNLGGIYHFDEMGDNPVPHTNEVAFFRVLKTDIARDMNDVYEKWPLDTAGNRLDPTNDRGFDPYAGDVNNPADPYYPGFSITNDPNHPWTIQHDPFRGTDDASDPDAGWDAVARTEGFYGPDPADYVPAVTSTVTIAVTGPGTLQWKNLIQDPSGEGDAAVWVSVDGGEPTRILDGDMAAWSDQEQIFTGDLDTPHTVTISFVNNSSTDPSQTAYGYLDNVVWTKETISTVPIGVEKVYDGVRTNIAVTVTKASDPTTPLDPSEYTIKYLSDPENPDSWTNGLSFVNMGVSNKVWYVVEVPGYDPITNFEYVTIWPREIVVTADDKTKPYGTPDPELTWVVTGGTDAEGNPLGILPGETSLVEELVATDPKRRIVREGEGTEAGEQITSETNPPYPITPSGSEYLGNYHVTYVPGTLTVNSVIAYSNIHGLLKIETAYTNTIIPAPWSDYSRDGSPTNDIRVDRMVKPRNLTDGDLLLQWANGGVYKAWILEKDEGEEGVWTPMNTAKQNSLVGGATNVIESFDAIYVKPDGSETQKRGYGLWLMRHNPLDAQDNPRPFYLYGQWLTGEETVTIGGTDADDVAVHYPGAHYGVVHDTMLANPDCTGGTDINGYPWTDADGADTIIINNDTSMHTYCSRLQKSKRQGGGWFEGWWQYGLSGYTQDGIATPVGVGFWYERRAAGPMTHTWTGAPKYAGDGQDHDVWIVDHADAGDGKTHLAFKLGGSLAPETVTRDFIKQLFESGSIRYLHATGATQAEGKAMLDSLTAALPEGARPVLALRNGTGVNTEEELAKGWIWVTVGVTDGTNAADGDTDGTGDTNGAGDLWRIVIGRGVWSEP